MKEEELSKQTKEEMAKPTLEQVETDDEEIFEPVLGELVADDAFSFTLLSCHC